MRERVDLKSPVRENRPPGSVRGAPGNWRPYLDKFGKLKTENGRRRGRLAGVFGFEGVYGLPGFPCGAGLASDFAFFTDWVKAR